MLRRPKWSDVKIRVEIGLTDAPDNVAGLARFCAELSGVEPVAHRPRQQAPAPRGEAR